MKILVLAGGYSSEREVSLSSGAKVTASLRATGHQARLWDVSEDISAAAARLFWRQPLPDIPDYQIKTPEKVETASAVMATAPTDTPGDWLAQEVLPGEKRPLMGTRVLDVAAGADIVFNVCHGGIGENGELAQLLAWRGIPFTGCSAAAAGLCMRKDLAKFFVKDVCATPRWYTTSLFHPIERDFPLPAIVKPVDGGSSIGVHRARSRRQLWALYQESIWTGIPMLFEERIAGRELSVGFLGEQILPPVEIVAQAGNFDYQAKYTPGGAQEICPAVISERLWVRLEATMHRLITTLGVQVYGRADFIIDRNEQIWFLEMNTNPGLTATSLLPQAAAAKGISYEAMCQKIIDLSLKKPKNREKLPPYKFWVRPKWLTFEHKM